MGILIFDSAEELKARQLKSEFADAAGVSFIDKALIHFDLKSEQSVFAKLKPEETMDAFAKTKPEWKGVMDKIKADPALAKSLHDALAKDPTMLDGIAKMAEGGKGKADPKEFETYLDNPMNRMGLTKVFDKIANDDKIKFSHFNDLYETREDKAKTMEKLKAMGIGPMDMMNGQGLLSMIKMFLLDPRGFMNQLSGMMGLQGEQKIAVDKIADGVGRGFEVITGGGRGQAVVDGMDTFEHKTLPSMQTALGVKSSDTLKGGAGNDTIGADGNPQAAGVARLFNDNAQLPRADNNNAPDVAPTAAELAEIQRSITLARAGAAAMSPM